MKLALAAVRRRTKPAAVKTAVSFKTGTYKPDFYALENENFIILRGTRVIVDGEIVVRPDYRAKLKETRPVERASSRSRQTVPRRATPKSASDVPPLPGAAASGNTGPTR